MRRRALLAALGTAAAPLPFAGCVSDESDGGATPNAMVSPDPVDDPTETPEPTGTPDDPRYETCRRDAIFYSELPAELRAEVDPALEGGAYETDGRLHLADAMNVVESYLKRDGRYYRPIVEEEDGTTTLQLEEEIPRRHGSFVVRHDGEEATSVGLTVTYRGLHREREEVVVEGERDLSPGSQWSVGAISKYGAYSARVVTASLDGTAEFRLNETTWPEGVSFDEESVFPVVAVADIAPCPWSD